MGFWDNLSRQFAKDESGRLVFLHRGRQQTAYFVDSADEYKIKSLVKIYMVAAALINVTGSTASIICIQAFTFGDHPAPLASRLKFALLVYAISATLFYIGPGVMLWKIYRGLVDRVCSSLVTADAASLSPVCASSNWQPVFLILAGLLILLLGIFFAISFRR